MSHRDLTPEQRRDLARALRKRRITYRPWSALRGEQGLYRCACSEDCDQRVIGYGTVSDKCMGEYEAVRWNADYAPVRRAGKKARAA